MSEPARPLHVAQFLPDLRLELGGVVRTVLDLCGALATRGHRITLITDDPRDVPAEWLAAGQPRVEVVPRLRAGFAPPALLARIEGQLGDIDVLHLHGPWLPANLQLARLARRRRIPYVVSVHGMLDDWSMSQKTTKKRAFLTLGARRMLEKAAFVHCTAEEERRQSARWYPRGNAKVVQCMCDLAPFPAGQRPPRDPSRAPRLLFLSRVHPKKGLELLIDAAARLRDAGQPVDVTIAGPGEPAYVRALEERVASVRLTDRVRLIGMVREIDEKVALYRACDVFVLPTSQENFGIVLIEAMACGAPVVTTRGVAIWRELADGGAVIVEPSPAALAEALAGLLRDPDALAARGEQGSRWVRRYADPDQVGEQFEVMYRAAISAARVP